MLSSQTQTWLPPMPLLNARPDIRIQPPVMAEPSSDVDTFKDREFVIGETFEAWLESCIDDDALKKVLISLTEVAFKEISDKIKEAATNK